jgi:hypothetical protein
VTDADLVDGQMFEVLESDLLETPMQVPLLDVLDRVPADIQMLGRVLDRRPPRQIQRIPFKTAGVKNPPVGEPDFHLPRLAAVKAEQPLDRQLDEDLFPADRNRAEPPGRHPALSHMAGGAVGAAEGIRSLLDAETDRPGLEIDRHFLIPADAKGMI